MNLCESINEELEKSKIKALANAFKDSFNLSGNDGFEIEELDGRLIIDSEGQVDSDDTSVDSIGPLEGFKEILDEWSIEEGDSPLDDKDIKAVIKEIKGMSITRMYDVDAFMNGPTELIDGGKVEQEYDIKLMDFKYDSKKDVLEVTKIK